MNIKKIAFRNFRKSMNDYLLFIISNIVVLISTYIFANIFQYFNYLQKKDLIYQNYMLLMLTISILIGVVAITFIYYALNNFIRARSKDYQILFYLGIKQKHFRVFVLIEYISISTFSLVLGLILGEIITRVIFVFLNQANLLVIQQY